MPFEITEEDSQYQAPAFALVSDTHTLLNNTSAGAEDQSFLDAASDFVTKGLPTVAIVALNEVENIPATIGNMFSGESDQDELTTNRQRVADFDDDLAQYYDSHQLGMDAMGFIVGSFIPGMAGVKVMRAGQAVARTALETGTMGSFTSSALGVIAPNKQKYLTQAIESLGQSGNAFKLTNADMLRAYGAGAWEQVLEGAVFTAAVNATMNQSPIMDQRSTSDLVWDVVIGGALGGAIGGGLSAVISTATAKRSLSAIEKELAPWSVAERPVASMTASDKIIFNLRQLDSLPEITPDFQYANRAAAVRAKTETTLWTEIEGYVGELTGGDAAMRQAIMKNIRSNTLDQNMSNLLEAATISRVKTTSAVEKELNAALKQVGVDFTKATPEQIKTLTKYRVAYVNMRDPQFAVTHERPQLLNLADDLRGDETISLAPRGDGIYVGKTFYKQENNPQRAFNIFGLTHKQVEARYEWAERLPKWVDDPAKDILVHETDIPLLQKAARDGVRVKVIPESGYIDDARVFASSTELNAFIRSKQTEIASRLAKAETIPQDLDTLVDKLKHYFGINFSTVDDPAGGYYGFFQRILGKGKVTGDVIALEKSGVLSRTLSEVARTLKHEEGHAIFQSLLESYGVGRANLDATWPALREEVMKLSRAVRPSLWKSTDPRMVAYRENWHEMFADSFQHLSRNPKLLEKYPEFSKFAGHLVRPIPQEILDAMAKRVKKPSTAEISKIVNAHEGVLSGSLAKDDLWNLRDHTRATTGNPKIFEAPSYAKIITDSSLLKDADGNLLEGMAILKQKEMLYRQQADSVVSSIVGADEAVKLPSAVGMHGKAIGTTSGPGFVTSEAGNYGSWSSFFSYVGQRTHALIKKFHEATSETFTPLLHKLAAQPDDAIEWSVLNERMRGLPNNYFLSDDGTKLVFGKAPIADDFVDEAAFNKALEKYSLKLEEAQQAGIPLEIEVKSQTVRDLIGAHISKNNQRRKGLQLIHTNNGLSDRFAEGVFYPIPRNPKDTPFFAYVVDNSVNGTGHSKMIYAKDAETLERMRNEIMSDPELLSRGIKVLTKAESEEYYKSIGKYEFERTLHDNYINTALARKGKSESFLPLTDPQRIVSEFMDWHLARDSALVRTTVEHKYAPEFSSLRAAADPAMQAAKSKFGYVSPLAYAEKAANNPAANLMKMALDISKLDEYPLWESANKFLDGAFSRLVDEVGTLFSKAQTPEHLEKISEALKRAGYEGTLNADALAAANATVPRGKLTSIINKANSLIATFALRADPFNALNNAVGSSVLLGAETKAVIRAIESGNAEAVGELAQLAKIKVPGTEDYILSPQKLIANRIAKFHADKEGREWFKEHGFISSITDQYDQTLDSLALAIATGDNVALSTAMSKAKQLGDAAEKFTANKLAEELNRYVAAGVMKDITDIAVRNGMMTEQSALTYINTFVNRTQGNYLASQRPLVFQGAVGQAIGLFQTYQFNLIQQLLRHVGEGQAKNAATMMGLQASVYGLNGLPGFNAINSHIIGAAGGNIEHRNMYDAIFSGAGKEAGEWLLYGGLSNAPGLFHPDLKTNIYSRGDVNPRHVTLVPVDPTKVPIYQATERLFSNIKESYQKVAAGADVWSTFLRGLEQNGISRPLTGLAQVLEAAGRDDKKLVSTNQQGNMLMAHDLAALSSLMRIAGAKPLDEAIVNDTMFRVNSYRTADAAKRRVLGEAVKLSILGGQEPDAEQVAQFAETYARTGGKQSEFASWYASQYRNANVSQAEQLRRKASDPRALTPQIIMNGGEY
jgi:hypothetical protein